jgi:hypothetical protein
MICSPLSDDTLLAKRRTVASASAICEDRDNRTGCNIDDMVAAINRNPGNHHQIQQQRRPPQVRNAVEIPRQNDCSNRVI